MRAVQLADIEAAVHVLLAQPSSHRAQTMMLLCERASIADRYRKRLRRPHREFGTGTLMSAAVAFNRVRRSSYLSSDYMSCLQLVAQTLTSCRQDEFS